MEAAIIASLIENPTAFGASRGYPYLSEGATLCCSEIHLPKTPRLESLEATKIQVCNPSSCLNMKRVAQFIPLGLISNLVQLFLNSWILSPSFDCLSLYLYYLCYLVLLNTLFVLSLMIARPHQLSIYGSHMIEDAYQSTHIYREVKAMTCDPGFKTCVQLTIATFDTYNPLSNFVLENRNMQVLQQRLRVRVKRSFTRRPLVEDLTWCLPLIPSLWLLLDPCTCPWEEHPLKAIKITRRPDFNPPTIVLNIFHLKKLSFN